ncbi:MAG: hypothetical protein R2939_16620 [Kofleriaceae bacterium]
MDADSDLPAAAPRGPLDPDPSTFLVSLHIVVWTAISCALIGVMVLAMLH